MDQFWDRPVTLSHNDDNIKMEGSLHLTSMMYVESPQHNEALDTPIHIRFLISGYWVSVPIWNCMKLNFLALFNLIVITSTKTGFSTPLKVHYVFPEVWRCKCL